MYKEWVSEASSLLAYIWIVHQFADSPYIDIQNIRRANGLAKFIDITRDTQFFHAASKLVLEYIAHCVQYI